MRASRGSLLLVIALTCTPVYADLEFIGPLTIGPSQDVSFVFPNSLPPDPDHKELQLTGTLTAPAGGVGFLQIDFDYLDAQLNTILVSAPNSPIFYLGGTTIAIDSGVLTLPFCPSQVSLHISNLSPSVPIEFEGIFRHECIEVPEPSSQILAIVAALSFSGLALLCRHRRSTAACQDVSALSTISQTIAP